MDEKQRLFVDMDGTLAVFRKVDELETLYEKGYFLNLAPQKNVLAAVRELIVNHPEIEVNILSAYLTDSQYALQEKNEWLDKFLPEIKRDHRVFVPCGTDKKEGIRGGVRGNDFLLDDYTKNLKEWQPPARGIKLLNGINHSRGTWPFDRLRHDRDALSLSTAILSIMRDENQIFDEKDHHGDHGKQIEKHGEERDSEKKRASVIDSLHEKQGKINASYEKSGKQKVGEKEWQI